MIRLTKVEFVYFMYIGPAQVHAVPSGRSATKSEIGIAFESCMRHSAPGFKFHDIVRLGHKHRLIEMALAAETDAMIPLHGGQKVEIKYT